MNKIIIELINKNVEALLYLAVGFVNTALNFVLFGFLTNVLDINYLVSNAIAWIFGVTFAFIANKYIVFKSYGNRFRDIIKEALVFIALRGMSGVFDMAFIFVFVDIMDFNNMVAKAIDIIIVVIINYITTKFVVFKNIRKDE